MKKVLRLTTSILGKSSVSSQLMDELIDAMKRNNKISVTDRDFAAVPIPHLDGAWLGALSTPAADRSEEQQEKVAFSDGLIAELQAADTLVIGMPMYNFSLPSMLKAWVDHIARAGVTFKYTETGSVGLLQGKKAYLVAAMGGVHERGVSDFLRPYMEQVLSFVGITDIEFITADGLNMSPEHREQGLAQARSQIDALLPWTNEEVAA